MKKILLVISLIAVLFLTGCSKKNNVNNSGDVINNSGNQTQGSGNEVIENLKNDLDQEKYKLSDSYYISGETFDEKDCLIDFQDLETKKTNNSNYDIESDGMQFNITCELGENSEYIFKINGEKIECDELKFSDYLKQKGLKAEFVALELNGKIVPRTEFENLILKKDDTAEVVHFVGGG